MNENHEEVLFKMFDDGWDCEMPVTLITWKDGTQDLHMQTGPSWDARLDKAEAILKDRGLKLKSRKMEFVGPSGGYITVERA